MKNMRRKWILLVAIAGGIVLSVMCMRLYIIDYSEDHIISSIEIDKQRDCYDVLILGSSILPNGQLSGILRERVETALDVYEKNPTCRILVSGNGTARIAENEVGAMRKYLINHGIDAEMILEDRRGFDTFQSMKNARDTFGVQNMIIVTQDFHLSRAIYIARSLGIDAWGIAAKKYPYRNRWEKRRNYLREFPAAVKAIFEVAIYEKI